MRCAIILGGAVLLGAGAMLLHGGDAAKPRPGASAGLSDAAALRLEAIRLEDQFGTMHEFVFPASTPMVLLVADKKGYERLAPWIEAAHERWRDRASIAGVADVRGVPGFLQGMVRGKFRSAQSYPVLLDWNGSVLHLLHPVKGVPNAFLLDAQGQVVARHSGEISPAKLDQLDRQLDAARGPTGENGVARPGSP